MLDRSDIMRFHFTLPGFGSSPAPAAAVGPSPEQREREKELESRKHLVDPNHDNSLLYPKKGVVDPSKSATSKAAGAENAKPRTAGLLFDDENQGEQ